MTAIMPPRQDGCRYIQIPRSSDGTVPVTAYMAIVHGLAYDRAKGKAGDIKFLTDLEWLRFMGPLERRFAGLKSWSRFFQSRVRSTLTAAGLMEKVDGGYLVKPTKFYFRMPFAILAHPGLTPSLKVHWSVYLWSAKNETGCVPEWCRHGRRGPITKSDQLHAKKLVKLGLATKTGKCYSLVPLAVATANFPVLLTGSMGDIEQTWKLWEYQQHRDCLLQRRDALAFGYRERFIKIEEQCKAAFIGRVDLSPAENEKQCRQETAVLESQCWNEFIADFEKIALDAKLRGDLFALGIQSDFTICFGRRGLDHHPRFSALPDIDILAPAREGKNRRDCLAEEGRKSLSAILGIHLC
jgi:hypothetical protein